MLHPMKQHFSIFISLLIIAVLAGYSVWQRNIETSVASSGDNVSGWAWSSNIGWVSFNCTNSGSCSQSDYGVSVEPNIGLMSGYAWSPVVGWISFHIADLIGCPSAPCEARVANGLSGDFPKEVGGWAKVLSTNSWMNLRNPQSGWTITGDTWAAETNFPFLRRDAAVASVNGKIYVIGGVTGGGFCFWSCPPTYHSRVDEYDPATNLWVTKASMSTARSGLAAVVLNNKIYAIGGYNSGGFLATNEEYDPVSNSWTAKASMPTARYDLMGAAANGRVYALGGHNGSDLAVNEEYNPATNTWVTRTALPTARRVAGAATASGKIYVSGGCCSGAQNTNYEYNPITGLWATKAVMPTGRYYHTAVAANNKVYAIGGYAMSKNEEYDPVTDVWTAYTDRPHVAYNTIAGAEAGGKIYVITSADGFNDEYAPPMQMFHHPYGVELDDEGNFSGWSWENQAIGWLRWEGPGTPAYGVQVQVGPPPPPPPPDFTPTTTPGGIRETRP